MSELLHYSQVQHFLDCQRRYYYDHVESDERADGPILAIGRTYHSALEKAWYELNPAVAADAALAANAEALTTTGAVLERDELVANVRRIRQIMCAMQAVPTYIEYEWELPELGYAGRLDALLPVTPLVNGDHEVLGPEPGPCVIDWKTIHGHRRRSQRDITFNAQLALYCLATGASRGAIVEIPRDTTKPLRTLVVLFSEVDLNGWRRWFASIRETILALGDKKENFAMVERSHFLCRPAYCPHYFRCYGDEK